MPLGEVLYASVVAVLCIALGGVLLFAFDAFVSATTRGNGGEEGRAHGRAEYFGLRYLLGGGLILFGALAGASCIEEALSLF
ncbi:hypothetical protein J0910_13985 [Nocardiopsis sp. CNT-189]|uniref:hypothetical protein n=1 Tax=Nocardiopsis oceanisediminis TaxID=2816862 RepID=UPI003B395B62